MKILEMDHTSSGVQIAAALARDARTAAVVNIAGGTKKSDLYTVVFTDANARLAALGSDVRLTRSDVKKAVIATIYGGTYRNAYEAFFAATGIVFSGESSPLYRALKDAVEDAMSGVVAVQRYVAELIRAIAADGNDSMTVRLAHGGLMTYRLQDTEAKGFGVKCEYVARDSTERVFAERLDFLSGDADVSGTAKSVTAGLIQSFDASMLAAVEAKLLTSGVRFLAKHDAYLIDESDFVALRSIVRETFFDFFSDDCLTAFRDDLAERYGLDLPLFDRFGSYDVSAVLASDFLISE